MLDAGLVARPFLESGQRLHPRVREVGRERLGGVGPVRLAPDSRPAFVAVGDGGAGHVGDRTDRIEIDRGIVGGRPLAEVVRGSECETDGTVAPAWRRRRLEGD